MHCLNGFSCFSEYRNKNLLLVIFINFLNIIFIFYIYIYIFFTVRRRALAQSLLSPGVCLPVMLVHCIQTADDVVKLLGPVAPSF